MLEKSTFLCESREYTGSHGSASFICRMLTRRRNRYAIFVLEASTSNRLTYFIPPLVRTHIDHFAAVYSSATPFVSAVL